MKICVLTHIFPARSETFVREHILGLARRGHDVTVIAREKDENINQYEMEDLAKESVRCIYLDKLNSRYKMTIAGLSCIAKQPHIFPHVARPKPWKRSAIITASMYASAIRDINPDIIHIHFGSLAARLHLVTKSTDSFFPVLTTWHGYEANALPNMLGSNIYHPLFSAPYKHTVGSCFMHERLCSLGAKPENIYTIPMGIALDRFTYREPKAFSSSEPLKILSVGRLDEMKGHTYLIKAVQKVIQNGNIAELKIVGDGPLKSDLEDQIFDAGLGNHVHLLGAKDSNEVLKLMHSADLFALTGTIAKSGKVETQGVVFAEAQATGLPVIASDVGGVPESIIDRQTGILCPPADVSKIQEAILFFINNRQELNNFSVRARKFVERKFSIEDMLNHFEEAYKHCLLQT